MIAASRGRRRFGVAGLAPVAALPTSPVVRNKAISVRATGQARLVSVVSARGIVRARFAFAPHGTRVRGTRTIMRGRNADGHVVLSVEARGNAQLGYRLRAVSGGRRSAWLSLSNRRFVLEAVMRLGKRPTLHRAH